MVQTENKKEHKSPLFEHKLPTRNSHDLTLMFDPYQRNPSDSPITTRTHRFDCYDRNNKLLQTLDLDSQRITQSSNAIQSALESLYALFLTSDLQ